MLLDPFPVALEHFRLAGLNAHHDRQRVLNLSDGLLEVHYFSIAPPRDNHGMATLGFIEYADASPEVRAVYDDIMATRQTDWINNFWKALAHDPATLRRTWHSIKEIMAPGALDALNKEMIYLAVSVTNQCPYCIASHTVSARKSGMTEQMFAELLAVVGMANETNRLSSGYQVQIDDRFKT